MRPRPGKPPGWLCVTVMCNDLNTVSRALIYFLTSLGYYSLCIVIRAVQCTAPIRDSFVQFPELHLLTAYGHIGPKAVRTRDTSALVRQFGPNGETVRTVCLDTSVLEPGHIGTTAEVSSYCAYGGTLPRQCTH